MLESANFLFVSFVGSLGFPGGSDGKQSANNKGVLGSIPGLGSSLEERNGNPLHCFCLENPHGEKSLVGYSPWGCKETDMSEQLTMLGHSSEPVALNGMNISSYWDVLAIKIFMCSFLLGVRFQSSRCGKEVPWSSEG